MKLIICIILIVVAAISAIVCAIVFVRTKKEYKRSDIHIIGGVDTDSGQFSKDENYFKGFTDNLNGTVVAQKHSWEKRNLHICICNIGTNESFECNLEGKLVIGRMPGYCSYVITNDNMVSKRHCCLFEDGGRLYAEDLGSANHTYLNGKIAVKPLCVNSGDIIKIGRTELKILY